MSPKLFIPDITLVFNSTGSLMQKTRINEKTLKFYLQTSWPLADTTAIFASMVYLESQLEISIKVGRSNVDPSYRLKHQHCTDLWVNKDSVDIQSGYFSIKMGGCPHWPNTTWNELVLYITGFKTLPNCTIGSNTCWAIFPSILL